MSIGFDHIFNLDQTQLDRLLLQRARNGKVVVHKKFRHIGSYHSIDSYHFLRLITPKEQTFYQKKIQKNVGVLSKNVRLKLFINPWERALLIRVVL